ncbi:MAG: oligosaccharide flippase family protein [Phycisphaerae bacterium]|nr:oligosaccharide flippase family protein [Phycisphaerae bacterium]
MSGEWVTQTPYNDSGTGTPAPRPPRWQRLKGTLCNDAQRLLVTGVPHLFMALTLTQGISLLRRILLARILTVPELGQMTYVMQIADLLAIVCDLGISTAMLKYAAEPITNEKKREYYCGGLFWGSLAATSGALIYSLAVWFLPIDRESAVKVFLFMVIPYIPLAAIAKIPIVYMQARKEIKRAARFTALTQGISLIMLVSATYYFKLWGFFITISVAPLSNLLILLTVTRAELRWFAPSWKLLKKLTSFGVLCVLANGTTFANSALSVVLLRHLTKSDDLVGLFAIGLLVMNGSRLLPTALMQTAFPYLSGILHDRRRLRLRVWELSIKQTLVMGVVAAAWYFVGPYAISILLGAKYAEAFWCTMILMLATVIFAASSSTAQALLILNRVHLNICAGLLLLAVNTAACLVLIPRFDIEGAAAALLISQLAGTCFSLAVVSIVLARGKASASANTQSPDQT